jgi:threonine/homoserine/homoserine lactone efflux protein
MPDFLPSLPVFLAMIAASVALAITPGPDMALFLGKTVAQSRVAGLAALAGATSGVVVHSILVALGLSALLAASATAFTILKVVGALYLLYLAYDAIRNGSAFSLKKEGPSEAIHAVYLKGLLSDLLNPKVIVFYVTFLPQFVSPEDPQAAAKLLILGITCAVTCVPVCLPMILFAEKIASLLKRSPRVTRSIDWLFASVLGAFAVRLLAAQSR